MCVFQWGDPRGLICFGWSRYKYQLYTSLLPMGRTESVSLFELPMTGKRMMRGVEKCVGLNTWIPGLVTGNVGHKEKGVEICWDL